jgi:cobalt/nickel transport system permease protein
MAKLDASFYDMGYLDVLSTQDTPIHRLDPRITLLTTLVFIVTVVSFGKYELSALLPFVLYPTILISLGNLPAAYLARKVLLALPFALFIGIFNPLMDRTIMMHLGPLGISGGWISFASIMVRFVLTATAAIVLVAVTGFNGTCMALEKIGAPRVFAVQLLFLYRYIFVLIGEAARLTRARSLRSFGGSGMGFGVFTSMVGQLLLRTLDRAKRIHLAMRCRGFDGEIRLLRPLRIGGRDVAFLAGWTVFFILMRIYDVPQWMGALVAEVMQ